MASPTKTNPAYAHLAYQVAITDKVIEDVMERYVGNEGSPDEEIVCEEIAREDSVVPEDAVLHFVGLLKDHKAQLNREKNRFEFVRRDDERNGLGNTGSRTEESADRESETASSAGEDTQPQEAGKKRRKRKR